MKNHFKTGVTILVTSLLFCGGAAISSEEAPPVLDYQNHPQSPEHNEIFTGELLSFDTKLSWTDRFTGDENFNESETLPTHRSNAMAMSKASGEQSATMSPETMQHMKMDGNGVVKSIRGEQGKVKIEHGPIDKFGMPEMTMMFKVSDPSMLEGLEKGDEIEFNVDSTSGGFVVTHIMSAGVNIHSDESHMGTMDATGMVKTIRASQGKVKIEHGPIEKFGMPAMTMVFKVQDAAVLDSLEQGMEVEFNVDSSSGGFEITDIKPIGK